MKIAASAEDTTIFLENNIYSLYFWEYALQIM